MSSKHLIRVPSSIRPGGPDRGMVGRKAVVAVNFLERDREVPPLWWWRRLPADAFTEGHLKVIRKAISGFLSIDEPYWPAAAKGNSAAAVGVALRAIKKRHKPSPGLDLVMSALLRCAIEGNAAAILVLAHVLDRMAAKDQSCVALAASWRSIKAAREFGRRRLKSA